MAVLGSQLDRGRTPPMEDLRRMGPRYSLHRADDGTWSVVDIFTDFPAQVGDRIMIRMDMDDADDMVDLLNRLDALRRARGQE